MREKWENSRKTNESEKNSSTTNKAQYLARNTSKYVNFSN